MKPGSVGAGLAAWAGAALSSLCCLLPLAVIVLGLGSGAFMAVTMQYRWILIPAGVLGVTTGFVLYVRERRREGDAMRGRGFPWLTIVVLLLLVHAASAATSTVVLAVEGMT